MLPVLLVTPDFPPAVGGIQTLMHRLVEHAERIDFRVVARSSPGAGEFDRSQRFVVRRAGEAGGGVRSNVALNAGALAEGIRSRPRAVLSAHIVASPSARALATLIRAPAVQYLHADELRTRPRLAAFAVRSRAVVAVSAHTRSLALAAGADPARVHVIPNGVDLPQRSTAARAARPTVITVARLERRYKGHDVMVRALARVKERVPDVEWVVVGDGSLRRELEEEVAGRALGDNVRFTGAVSDAERDALLDGAHVFAMPSRLPDGGVGGEGFGIVYLEAAARAVPVVAGNVGGALDAVVDGQTGLLVDPTDDAAVAEAISSLLLDRERADRLGGAGLARSRSYAWPRIGRELEDLLLELAG